MTELPDVTLICIDVVRPFHAVFSMTETLRLIAPRDSVLLTDIRRYPGVVKPAREAGIKVVDHQQSNETMTLPGVRRKFFPAYEEAAMTQPLTHINPSSSHVLFMEADAGVLNPLAWDKKWLRHDFIGAPWPPHVEFGWPPCDGKTNAVGNTGFSLRSRKFLEAVARALVERKDDPYRFCHDSWICRTIRPWLEAECKIKFAPVDVAARFSCENRIYSGSFGFHGRSTVILNNWGGWYHDLIVQKHPLNSLP